MDNTTAKTPSVPRQEISALLRAEIERVFGEYPNEPPVIAAVPEPAN